MKKLVLALVALSLAGCDRIPTKIGEEVRPVEIGDSMVSDGWNTVVYQTESDLYGLDLDNNEAELYVDLIETNTGQKFRVSLGSECNSWPAPKGERFLARFDRSASKAKPKDIYIAPQSAQVFDFLCR